MPYIEAIAVEKARLINNVSSIYGTFAEIGAGQGVVAHFFKAGGASQTVAKSMSAYDMTFSDEIYGKTNRYVSENRLLKMLDHEYKLLQKRLTKSRGKTTRFFAFANTVSVSTSRRKENLTPQHGWIGLRFQHKAQGPYNQVLLHLSLKDKTRLQQHETLGVLGVNLIYSAFFGKKTAKSIIKSLVDNFETSRINIDLLKCRGQAFKNLTHRELNLELMTQGLTRALLFKASGESVLHSDTFYEKNIICLPGNVSNSVTKNTLQTFKNSVKIRHKPPVILKNIPLKWLKKQKPLTVKKLTSSSDFYTLVSHFDELYQLKAFLRQSTTQGTIYLLLPQKTFRLFLNTSFYKNKPTTALEFFSKLCDKKTHLVILDSEKTTQKPTHLQKYLEENKNLIHLKIKT